MSTGSAFSAFEKLQGAKNYTTWKNNMETILLSLWQWSVIAGKISAPPPPADPANPTTEEIKVHEAWEVHEISAFMEILF